MPVADDDYRKRFVMHMRSKEKKKRENAFSSPGPGLSEKEMGRSRLLNASNSPIFKAFESGYGGGAMGTVSKNFLGRLATPALQRAIQMAGMEGKSVGAQVLEGAAMGGVTFPQSGIARAGRGAEDELFNILGDLERMGAKPQTVNRLLRGFSLYADDPAEAMITMGAKMDTIKPTAKELLIERLLKRIGDAAEDSFF